MNHWAAPLPDALVHRAQQTRAEIQSTVCRSLGVDGAAWEVRLAGSFLNGTATLCSSDIDLHVIRVDRYAYELPAQPGARAWVQRWLSSAIDCGFLELRRRIEWIVVQCFGDSVVKRPKAMHIKGDSHRIDADVVVGIEHRRYTGTVDACGQPTYIAGVELRSREDPDGRVICYPCSRWQAIEDHDHAAMRRSRPLIRILKCVRHAMRHSGLHELEVAARDIPSCLIEALLVAVPAHLYHGSGDCYWNELRRVVPHAISLVATPRSAATMTDLGGDQPLFGGQWSRESALRFLQVAWKRLEVHDLPLS
ncbi:hypothetical protein [Nannocystis sp. SCPEA4]|uniref:hypothetical protein n=1 Tax=Nannocystis sp. SCPEA4 TaxID=2996787 RepID=UPI002271B56D|nr:hypothetical protein [Nannocystis sp. SCPEA4]MCY1054334.1 hypothetical protein [Nannocystis sp. SCPEA4]